MAIFEGEPRAIGYETRQGKYQDRAEIVTLARV
jgi:dCTP deaminase